MTLRLFGRSDDVLSLLLRELGLRLPSAAAAAWPRASNVLVPYDASGRRLEVLLLTRLLS